jgi:DNA topoisomerase I
MAGRLRRSKTNKPGIARRRTGRGFTYTDPGGRRVTDAATLDRIKSLAIPPAWARVWICPWPNGHIQAMGTDTAGRRQYMYHPAWREVQDHRKFDRALEFGARLPKIRSAVSRHLGQQEDPQLRALAAAVRLLDVACLRTGAEEYAADNGSYGATTLQRRHVITDGDSVTLDFPGKSGKHWTRTIEDEALTEFFLSLPRRGATRPLLGYPKDGNWTGISGAALNSYLSSIAGEGFTAKDFRTWQGTATAARALAKLAAEGHTSKKAVAEAMKEVAEVLNNTPTIARASYVDPRVIALFEAGKTASLKGSPDAAAVRLLTEAIAEDAPETATPELEDSMS